jgi:hypothetical protein
MAPTIVVPLSSFTMAAIMRDEERGGRRAGGE